MRSRTTKHFRQQLAKLPPPVRQLAKEAFQQFQQDPRHPGLRFKKVHPHKPIYSARISQDFRAVGVLRGPEIIWFFVGSHKEYDAKLKGV